MRLLLQGEMCKPVRIAESERSVSGKAFQNKAFQNKAFQKPFHPPRLKSTIDVIEPLFSETPFLKRCP
jgi:hypothetical protein